MRVAALTIGPGASGSDVCIARLRADEEGAPVSPSMHAGCGCADTAVAATQDLMALQDLLQAKRQCNEGHWRDGRSINGNELVPYQR